MNTILKTRQLEFDKSTFLVDLIKQDKGAFYIEILQRVQGDTSDGQKIKINPTVFTDLVRVLVEFYEMIPNRQFTDGLQISEDSKKKIEDRYYRGISTSDLALQFDCSVDLVEMILRNRGVEILADTTPTKKKKYWRRRS
ncbi:MAG: hypothetical protein ACKO1F_14595 [Flammeovirgaceae bacterium]